MEVLFFEEQKLFSAKADIQNLHIVCTKIKFYFQCCGNLQYLTTLVTFFIIARKNHY